MFYTGNPVNNFTLGAEKQLPRVCLLAYVGIQFGFKG